MRRCDEIHLDTLCVENLEEGWRFCPSCGRKNGAVRIESHFAFDLPYCATREVSLPVAHQGDESVNLRVELPNRLPVTVISLPPAVRRPSELRVRLENSADKPFPKEHFTINVFLDDGLPLDIWDDHSRWRQQVVTIQASTVAPAVMEVEQQVVIFHDNMSQRRVRIFNRGVTPLELQPLVPPIGYELVPDGNVASGPEAWNVAGGSYRDFVLRCHTATAGISRLEVATRNTSQAHDLTLVRLPEEEVEALTQYAVGIDFGTSNTSIIYRDRLTPDAPANFIPDPSSPTIEEGHRFPSLIFVQLDANRRETGFYIGYEAERKYLQDPSGGFVVRELKTLLRKVNRPEDEPYTRFGSRYTSSNLLKRYLVKLYEEFLAPVIDGATVAWCFSLPVLDSHQGGERRLWNLQYDKMRRAVEDAGYLRPGCTFHAYTEPFCAAVYLIMERGEFRFGRNRPQEGEWACVFDSGGGTTDVVLGRLTYESGRLRFQEVTTLGVHHLSGASAGQVTTFGGERLTESLADYVDRDEIANYLAVRLDPETAEDLAMLDDIRTGKQTWPFSLLREVDGIKRQLAAPSAPDALPVFSVAVRSDSDATEEVKTAVIHRSNFNTLVDVLLQPLRDEMDHIVFLLDETASDKGGRDPADIHSLLPTPEQVQWVFPVGGNTLVERIGEEFLPQYFHRVQSVSDRDRILAVAGGTVWAPDARRDDALPYTIFVQDADGNELFRAYVNDPFSLREYEGHRVPRRIPPGRSDRLYVWTQIQDGTAGVIAGRVHTLDLRNDDTVRRDIFVTFRFERRTLIIESDRTNATQVELRYEV